MSIDHIIDLYRKLAYYQERILEINKQLGKEATAGVDYTTDILCKECYSNKPSRIYYPGQYHHLDGIKSNKALWNLAMICPFCNTHILMSRNIPEYICKLRLRGMNNAKIGRLLGISRERVRKLGDKYRPGTSSSSISLNIPELVRISKSKKLTPEEEAKLNAGLDELVRQRQETERSIQRRQSIKKRLPDKRTLRKLILNELKKQGKRGGKP